MTTTDTAIDVHNLVMRFGDRTVVDHVTMQVQRGEIAGFLGPNGSGKTTTIRVMCGLLTPDEGNGTVLGMDIRTQAAAIKRQIGYMTQKFSLYADLSIEENLAFVARLYRLSPVKQVVRDTLDELGLTLRAHQLAGALSGGWKQRLALAACLMHKPKLLLLDEPTAGVDPKARREFWDEIHTRAAEGLTVLVSTHYMDEAERCHRINYISYGKLIAQGTVQDVVREAKLTTWIMQGDGILDATHLLQGKPGIEQIAPFGNTLHVVGTDDVALGRSVRAVAKQTGTDARRDDTSLEDVFIHLMSRSEDNMA